MGAPNVDRQLRWRKYLLLLLLLFWQLLPTTVSGQTLRLVSAQWSSDTAYEESTQLHFSVIKEIFSDHYNDFQLTREPFKRAVHSARAGKYDVLLVTFSSDYAPRAGLVTSTNPIDVARVVAITHKDRNVLWQSVIDSPQDYQSAWINGYAYESLFGFAPSMTLPKGDLGLKMLIQGRLDVYIDDFLGVQIPLNGQLKELRPQLRFQDAYHIPLHPSFPDSEKGKALKAIFDREFETDKKQQALAKIYHQFEREFPIATFGILGTPSASGQ